MVDENGDGFFVREALTQTDIDYIYRSGYATLFSIRLHHGGKFTKWPSRTYVKGKIDHIDMVDVDRFCVHDLDDVMLRLGYTTKQPIFYHFLQPGKDLNYGLQPLCGDADVLKMTANVPQHRLIFMYTEHGSSSIPIVTQSHIRIEEIVEDENNMAGDQTVSNMPNRKKSHLMLLEWDGQNEGQNEGVTTVVSPALEDIQLDDLFTYANQEDEDQNMNEFNGVHGDENVEENEVHDEENEVHGEENKVHDEENEVHGEENEVHDEENEVHGEENEVHDEENEAYKDSGSEMDDDHDSDYIIDDDNSMGDYDVDMRDFKLHVDSDVEEVLEDAVDTDDIEDEILDNDTFEDVDENGRQRRVRNVNSGSIQFYLGQMFGTKEECKQLIREHSVQTRRNIRIIKDEDDRVRAICKGNMGDVGTSSSKEPSLSKKKGKDVALQIENSGGATMKLLKSQGATLQKQKGKGLASEKDNKKGKDSVTHVGGRGKKANPYKYQCPWVLLLSKDKECHTWEIRTLVVEHNCLPLRSLYSCTSSYISKKIVDQVAENPSIPIKAVQEQMQRELQLRISRMKAYRAKAIAKEQVQGDYTSQYSLLRDYVQELKSKNPGTTVKIEVEPVADPSQETRRFKRIYICLGALKRGFKAIGRDLLGLDGAFMKGPFPGQILTAVGIDPNNGIYPVCYAIVEAETLDSWTWFLELLGDDLGLSQNSNFTFVSDRQKGLLPAMAKVFPSAEHRFCLRHIHENFKQTFKGQLYKDIIWKLATSTTVVKFKNGMEELKKLNPDAHQWLSNIPPEHWSRSHFSGRAISDVLLNNMCEVFNGKISEGRDKPIISALEFIREYLMRRIVTVLKHIERSDGLLTPTISKLFEQIKSDAGNYLVSWNGGEQYQVSSQHDQVVVDLGEKWCACRRWEISGIPCRHAVAAIWDKHDHNEDVSHLLKWVNPIYTIKRWKEVYSHRINPLNGRALWEKVDVPTTLTPPTHHTQVGRPKKARKRSAVEMEGHYGKKSKKNMSISCSKCGNKGHNQRTCKGQRGDAQGQGKGGVRSHAAAAQVAAAATQVAAAATQGKGGVRSHAAATQVAAAATQSQSRLPKQNTCSNCGGKGHNKKTCKAKGKQAQG
ncbi:hypothetical protein SSX86_026009 [Deinandra increscens subsp. villosa]|uniref:SWIM-type domain-containing protein n=1 Tax=Deinandra increscens subsp. villosa TaxID=3103831 RepID=A0AAP0GPQ2_9ASTR